MPFTVELIDAVRTDRSLLTQHLGAYAPDDWPGPDFADLLPLLHGQLAHNPADGRWIRLIVHATEHVLVGDVGCHGPPDANDTVEIGYSIVPAYRNHGYATEAAQGFVDWLWTQHVARITAECERTNIGSVRVLEKLGMQRVGQNGDMLRWELTKH